MPILRNSYCFSFLFILIALTPSDASPQTTIPGVGAEAQGADLAVTHLDHDPRPELIFMAYYNPPQGNAFRYKIGWNVNGRGEATSWSNSIEIPGIGWESQGAGVAVFVVF